jgi:amino acid transporter
MAEQEPQKKKKAGAFDIRVVIAALIAVYGLVLTILGIIADPAEVAKADGLNINLWGGIAMLVFAAVFVLWARLRPIVVPVETSE